MPISASFSELNEELNEGIHIMCIVLLCTRRFPELKKFDQPPHKAFERFSVAVYILIFTSQFCAMIIHCGVKLACVDPASENCIALYCNIAHVTGLEIVREQ